MNKSALLFKTLYRNATAPSQAEKGKKRISRSVGAILSISPLVIMIAVLMAFLASSLKSIADLSALLTSVLFATQMMVLFLSMASMFSTLYDAKDTPFLQSLPIKPTGVFFAKFALVYVNALKLSVVAFLPIAYAVTITFNVVNHTMFYGAYPLILLVALVAPVLPLFVAVLFSMPIAYIGSYFKGKPTLKSVLTIIFYVILMGAYMVVVYFMNTKGFGQEGEVEISQGALSSLYGVARAIYPDKVLVDFCYGINVGKNFGISAACVVGMIAVMILLAMAFYKRINVKKSETAVQSSSSKTTLKQENIVISLVKRDFKSIIRNSTLAMTSLANSLMAPIFIVVMYFITGFKEGNGEAMSSLMSEMMGIGYIVMYSMIFLAGANLVASLAYTREGKSFFATKSLPIKPIDSIKSKVLLATIVPAVIMIPIMLISLLLFKIDIVSTLLIGVDTMLMVVGINCLNVLFDMKKGNQHWEDVSELRNASRGNYYQIISAFMAIIPAVALFLLGLMLSIYAPQLGDIIVKVIFWAVATVISVVVLTIGLCIIKSKGIEYYALIGLNKPEKRAKSNFNRRGMIK